MLSTDGKTGVRASYFEMRGVDLEDPSVRPPILANRAEPGIDAAAQPLPAAVAGKVPLAVHWEANLTAPETGDYELGLECNGLLPRDARWQAVTSEWDTDALQAKLGRVHLVKGAPSKLVVDYGQRKESPDGRARLVEV